jgi:hypothetical protein
MVRKYVTLAAAGALLAVAACSSTAGSDAPAGPAAPDTAVLDSCIDFAARLCADAQGCCERAHGGFDQDACVATFRREVCKPGADAVKAERATFNEASIESCLAAHAAAHAVCVPTWAQTLELRKEIYVACRVIDGLTEPGQGCSISATCKRPDGVGTSECIKNVCRVIDILPEGAECPFPSGSVPVCDEGLACDAPGLGTTGICIKAVASGESCDSSALEGTDCGLGSYCDPETSRCAVAENRGGAGCAQSTECVSFECNRIENECAPAPAVVDRATCLGAPLEP